MTLKPISMKQADEALVQTGLLFALNHHILHPLGLALALSYPDAKDDTAPTHLLMMATAHGKAKYDTPIEYAPETLALAREKLVVFLNSLREQDIVPTNVELLQLAVEEGRAKRT